MKIDPDKDINKAAVYHKKLRVGNQNLLGHMLPLKSICLRTQISQ